MMEGEASGLDESLPKSATAEPEKKKSRRGRKKGEKPADMTIRQSVMQRKMTKERRQHERERHSQIAKLYESYSFLRTGENQEISRPSLQQVGEAASVISAILLIDVAAGMLPGVTMAQRIDAAKELRKNGGAAGNQTPDDLRHLLQSVGIEGAKDLIKAQRSQNSKTVDSDSAQDDQPARLAE